MRVMTDLSKTLHERLHFFIGCPSRNIRHDENA